MRTGALFVGAVLLLLLRRPLGPLVNEDGLFLLRTFQPNPLASIIEPLGGYLDVAPRIGMLLARLAPIELVPAIAGMLAYLVTAAVAVFLAERLPFDRRLRVALAVVFLLLPATDDLFGHLYQVKWHLAVFLLAASVCTLSKRWAIPLLVAGLSGPFSILFAPLYWRRRDWTSVLVTGCAVVQLVALSQWHQPAAPTVGVGDAVQIVGLRAILEPFLGATVTEVGLALGVPLVVGAALAMAIGVLVVLAVRGLPRGWLVLGYAAVVVLGLGLWRTVDPVPTLLESYAGSRYFGMAGLALAAVTVAAIARRNRAGYVLGALLLIGIVGDFRLVEAPDLGWSVASCLGQPEPCRVPIPWGMDIVWPGAI